MTGSVHLRWVDELPPARPRAETGQDHHLIAAALRDQPGRWAMLPDLNTSYTSSINYGTNIAYRPAGWYEAIARQGVLYARYIGGPS